MWRIEASAMGASALLLLTVWHQLVTASAPAPSVTRVNASTFDPSQYDAVFDVRNQDEWAGGTSGHSCSIGSVDPSGCSYGHIPDAVKHRTVATIAPR